MSNRVSLNFGRLTKFILIQIFKKRWYVPYFILRYCKIASPIEHDTANLFCETKERFVAYDCSRRWPWRLPCRHLLTSARLIWFVLTFFMFSSSIPCFFDWLNKMDDRMEEAIDKIEKPVESRWTVFAATQNIEKPNRGRGRPKKVWNLYCFAGMRFVLKSLFKGVMIC